MRATHPLLQAAVKMDRTLKSGATLAILVALLVVAPCAHGAKPIPKDVTGDVSSTKAAVASKAQGTFAKAKTGIAYVA